MPPWRLALGLAVVAGYMVASHLLMTHAPDAPWAVAVILGPLLLAAIAWASQRRDLTSLVSVAVAITGLVGIVVRGGVQDVNRLYVLQHAGVHLTLGLAFAMSLRAPPGRSLIGLLASRIHHLTPAMEHYTHAVTRAWSIYFFAMTAASLVVYAAMPWSAWSVFANLVTPLAAVLMFVGEHQLRYRRHPEFERVSLADGLRAWQERRTGASE